MHLFSKNAHFFQFFCSFHLKCWSCRTAFSQQIWQSSVIKISVCRLQTAVFDGLGKHTPQIFGSESSDSSTATLLQHYIVSFYFATLIHHPEELERFRDLGYLDLLFSSSFFMLKIRDGADQPSLVQKNLDKSSVNSNGLDSFGQSLEDDTLARLIAFAKGLKTQAADDSWDMPDPEGFQESTEESFEEKNLQESTEESLEEEIFQEPKEESPNQENTNISSVSDEQSLNEHLLDDRSPNAGEKQILSTNNELAKEQQIGVSSVSQESGSFKNVNIDGAEQSVNSHSNKLEIVSRVGSLPDEMSHLRLCILQLIQHAACINSSAGSLPECTKVRVCCITSCDLQVNCLLHATWYYHLSSRKSKWLTLKSFDSVGLFSAISMIWAISWLMQSWNTLYLAMMKEMSCLEWLPSAFVFLWQTPLAYCCFLEKDTANVWCF